MTEKLSIFSTVEDLRRCSDDDLVAGIDAVGREVILAYLLELREKLKQAELGTDVAPSAPPAPPESIPEASNSEKTSEMQEPSGSGKTSELQRQLALCKSTRRTGTAFPVEFRNETNEAIDLIWKDYDGKEVIVKQDLLPSGRHTQITYLTHPFIAREVVTRKLRVFEFFNDYSVVFEGFNFGVNPKYGKIITISKSCPECTPMFQVQIPPDSEEGEGQAALSKSSRQGINLKVKFVNQTPEVVELIWKDHNGNEVRKQDIKPWGKHKEDTYFTYPFIAREKTTRKLRSFRFGGISAFVFEGHNFGIKPGLDYRPEVHVRYLHDCING